MKEKLKQIHQKTKNTFVVGGLALAAAFAPFKGQAMEKAIEKDTNETIKQNAQHNQKIQFPEWIPVTADGQFDEAVSREWVKTMRLNQNIGVLMGYYQKVHTELSKPQPNMAVINQSFHRMAHKMFRHDKKAQMRLQSSAPILMEALKQVDKERKPFLDTYGLHIGLLIASLCLGGLFARKTSKSLKLDESSKMLLLGLSLVIVPLFPLLSMGIKVDKENNKMAALLEEKFVEEHKKMYDAYLKGDLIHDQEKMSFRIIKEKSKSEMNQKEEKRVMRWKKLQSNHTVNLGVVRSF